MVRTAWKHGLVALVVLAVGQAGLAVTYDIPWWNGVTEGSSAGNPYTDAVGNQWGVLVAPGFWENDLSTFAAGIWDAGYGAWHLPDVNNSGYWDAPNGPALRCWGSAGNATGGLVFTAAKRGYYSWTGSTVFYVSAGWAGASCRFLSFDGDAGTELYVGGGGNDAIVDLGAASGLQNIPLNAGQKLGIITTCSGGTWAYMFMSNAYWGTAVKLQYEPFMATVRGTAAIGGYLADNSSVGITINFTPAGGGPAITRHVFLGADGGFQLDNIPQDTYTVSIKAQDSLREVRTGVPILAAEVVLDPFELKGADCNGDNSVSFEDFSMLQNNYGQSGGAGANPLSAAAGTGGCGPVGILMIAVLGLALRCRD